VKKKNSEGTVPDMFEAARLAFFSGDNGTAAASPRQTFTQVKTYDGPVTNRAIAKATSIADEKPELLTTR
jgi:hypothetical protein